MSTKIDYVDKSWNPVIGCTKIAAGCKNCYAEKYACRLNGIFAAKGDEDNWADYSSILKFDYSEIEEGRPIGWNGTVCLRYKELDKPLHWRRPARILLPSMGDLFHKKVPFEFINQVYWVIGKARQHKYFILTKRPQRAIEFAKWRVRNDNTIDIEEAAENRWLGTSISTQEDADKNIPELLKIPGNKWVSIEPMIEDIDLTGFRPWYGTYTENQIDKGISWVVVGCESGTNRRQCEVEWIREIVADCGLANVPCYVKQVPINGKVSHDPKEWPEDLRIREYPDEKPTKKGG